MIHQNKGLDAMVSGGWTPTYHGEFIDEYNRNSTGFIASTICAGIFTRNHHFVVIEYDS